MKRRELITSSGLNNNDDDSASRSHILTDHIVLNEETFTRDEVRDHILTFMGGYETIAMQMRWLMRSYYLRCTLRFKSACSMRFKRESYPRRILTVLRR